MDFGVVGDFIVLFVLVFWWDVLVSYDCDGVILLFGGIDC